MNQSPHADFRGTSAPAALRTKVVAAPRTERDSRVSGDPPARDVRPNDREKIDVSVLAADDVLQQRLDTLAWALVGMGVVLRLGRYLLDFPFWGDEMMFAQNLLDRGYGDLLKPLSMQQVAPLGYLAIELTAIKLLGFSALSLRLFAVLSSIGGLLLFRDLANRLLGKVPMVLAVGILSVSYYPIRHAAECKPYASDLTASLVLVWLAVRWWQSPGERRWLWGLAAAGPLMVALSNPTIFVAGGIGLALAPAVWRSRDRRTQAAFVAYGALTVGTFYALLRAITVVQYDETKQFMLQYWAEGFPPLNPLKFISWFASLVAGEMMAYPVGDDHFGSILTLCCFVVGVGLLVRRKQQTLAALILAPVALALVASALRRYPFGGARLSQYYGALACFAIGLGAAVLIGLLRQTVARRRVFGGVVAALVIIGAVTMARDMSHPYKREVDYDHRCFARWFWKATAAAGEVVCVRTDLGLNFYDNAMACEDYLCYQRALSVAHRRGPREVRIENLPTDRPLCCVLYSLEGVPRDEARYNAWMAEMTSRYELAAQQSYRVKLNAPREPARFGIYTVCEFRRRAAETARATDATPDASQR